MMYKHLILFLIIYKYILKLALCVLRDIVVNFVSKKVTKNTKKHKEHDVLYLSCVSTLNISFPSSFLRMPKLYRILIPTRRVSDLRLPYAFTLPWFMVKS